MRKTTRRRKEKPPKDFFTDWLYRKHLLSGWVDCHGKGILSNRAKTRAHARAFGIIVETRASLGAMVKSLVSNRRCIVDCGSMCCYFPAGRGLGVYLSEAEAEKISSLLREMGLEEKDCIKESALKGGKPMRYLRLDKSRRVPKKPLASSPKLLSGEKLWIGESSLACMLLRGGNVCRIYDVRPRSCRAFICKTGDMMNYLFSAGVIVPSYLDDKKGSEINDLADRCLLVFSDEGMRKRDSRITVAFMELVKEYLKDGKNLDARIKELVGLASEYDKKRGEILRIV